MYDLCQQKNRILFFSKSSLLFLRRAGTWRRRTYSPPLHPSPSFHVMRHHSLLIEPSCGRSKIGPLLLPTNSLPKCLQEHPSRTLIFANRSNPTIRGSKCTMSLADARGLTPRQFSSQTSPGTARVFAATECGRRQGPRSEVSFNSSLVTHSRSDSRWLARRQSGGSFGDAFGRPHGLQGEVSPKRGAAIDAQLEAEDQALLEQKRARKGESGHKEE